MIKPPTPSEIFTLAIKSFISLLKNYPIIQYAWIFPFFWISTYIFGFWNTWVTLAGVTISYLIKGLFKRKNRLYEAMAEEYKQNDRGQKCAWVNLLIRKYWISCLPKLLEPIILEQRAKFEPKIPKFLNFQMGEIKLGRIAPQIDQIITFNESSENHYTMDCYISFLPEASVEISLSPYKFFTMNVLAHELKFRGRMRIKFQLNNLFPELSTIGVSFVKPPQLEVTIKPNGKLDIVSLPFLYHWIYDLINLIIGQMMLFPKCLLFTMGGGDIDTAFDEPITDIKLFHPSPECKVPKGYFLLQRTSEGNIAANFNYRNPGKPIYLCYKRGGEEKPITELAIILPGCGETPPENFTVIEHTINNEYAPLNTSPDGTDDIFLCYSRDPTNGAPITGFTLYNSEEGLEEIKDYRKIELTPTGQSGNINRDPRKKLSLYLGYKGGCSSPFGFFQNHLDVEEGILRVTLVSGRNLMIADVGGTSDPYCTLMLIKDKNFAEPVRIQKSKIIPKNLNPYWGETFYFNHCKLTDLLLVKCYDHDLVGSDDYLGTACINISNLVMNKQVDQWFTLQHVEHGDIRLKIAAINFGMTTKTVVHGAKVINRFDPPSRPTLISRHSFQNVHSASPPRPSLANSPLSKSSSSSLSPPPSPSINVSSNSLLDGQMVKEIKNFSISANLNYTGHEDDYEDGDEKLVTPLLQISVAEKDAVDKFQDAVGEIGKTVGEKGIKTVAAVGDIGVRAVGTFFKKVTRDKSKKEYEKKCQDIGKETFEGKEYACIEGFLEQRSSNHITWNSRYFVLKNYMLNSYKKNKTEEEAKKTKLTNANICLQSTENVFKITTEDGEVLRLRAADEETTFKWFRAISRNISIAKEGRFSRPNLS